MSTRMRGVVRGVATVFMAASTVWGLWFTWVVAFGGHLPPPFADYVLESGNLLLGVLAFFIGIPLIDTVFFWAGTLLALAIVLPFTVIRPRPRRRPVSTPGVAAGPEPVVRRLTSPRQQEP